MSTLLNGDNYEVAIHAEIYDYMLFNLFKTWIFYFLTNEWDNIYTVKIIRRQSKVNSFVQIICLNVGCPYKISFYKKIVILSYASLWFWKQPM